MHGDEDEGNDREVEVHGLAGLDQAVRESAGLAAYLEKQLGTGAQAEAIRSLTGALEHAASQAVVVPEFSKALAVWSAQQGLLDQVARNLAVSPALTKIAENLRLVDQMGESIRLLSQRSIVADWSELTLGFTAVTSWRTSLAMESHFERMLADVTLAQLPQLSMVKDLASITKAQVRFTDWVVQQDATSRLLGEISGQPLGLWRGYVDSLPVEPDDRDLLTSVTTGRAGLGLLGADVLQSGADDSSFVELAIEHVESDVLAPWDRERLRVTKELYARLEVIEPTVPEFLQRAWEEVQRDGPAGASLAAHCVVESLDRVLRAAAPDDAVRAWHTTTGRPAKEWEGRDKPTRALRVKYIAAQLGSVKDVVVAEYESLTKLLSPLHGRLEAVKHASVGDVLLVRSLLLTAECFLAVLFLDTES